MKSIFYLLFILSLIVNAATWHYTAKIEIELVMKNLKILKLSEYISKDGIEKIKKNGLDFTFCPNLEKLTLEPILERFYFIPDIKISSKKAELYMHSQNIKTVSKEENAILARFVKIRQPENIIQQEKVD